MSETAGTIIKILSALTSPKACVKYITVAAVLLFLWKYLEPLISETNISREQLSIIILLLGVGAGSLLGQVISWGIGYVWEKHESKRNDALIQKKVLEETRQKQVEKESENALLLKKIQSSFEHLHLEQKKTLRKLTLGDKTIDISESDNLALQKNGYIQTLVHVSDSDYLTQINPSIREFVQNQWAEEKESKVKNFLEHNDNAMQLLDLLEDNEENEAPIAKELLDTASRYSECIRGDNDETEDRKGYWLWFEEYLLDEFERQTGRSYVDEVFIPSSRILVDQATA